jgi:hypothetical protein
LSKRIAPRKRQSKPAGEADPTRPDARHILTTVIIPAIATDILTGLRLALVTCPGSFIQP